MIAGGKTAEQLRNEAIRATAARRAADRKAIALRRAERHFAQLLRTVAEPCRHDDLHAGTCSKCGAR